MGHSTEKWLIAQVNDANVAQEPEAPLSAGKKRKAKNQVRNDTPKERVLIAAESKKAKRKRKRKATQSNFSQ